MQASTLHRIICFFTKCKYRDEEGNCLFTGPLIISLECDCQCMESNRVEITSSATRNLYEL